MRTVHKFPITESELNSGGVMDLPVGDVVLVAAQNPSDMLPTIWLDVDTDEPFHQRLQIAGTGQEIYADIEHVGSAVCADGRLVWHVYRVAS